MKDNANTPQPAEAPAESSHFSLRQLGCDLMDIIESAVITVFLFLLVFSYLLRPVTVEGFSMRPTLFDEDRLLITTTIKNPKNGDILVIDDQEAALFTDEDESEVSRKNGLEIVIVKRLIAKGGQEVNIDFEHGGVAVDGVQLVEPYIAALTTRNDGAFTYPFTVPEGYYFVLGDNRNGSTDSRNPAVGLVPEEQLIGVALLRYDRAAIYRDSWLESFGWLLK